MPTHEYAVNTVIDQEKCIGCGLCVEVCSSDTITMVDGKAAVTGTESLNCGHCTAVCPVGAINVTSLDENMTFRTFEANHNWAPYGRTDLPELVRLMGSRRSCRNYMDDPVEIEKLEDLVKIGTTAPSGSNCQMWTFTILPERSAVLKLAQQVGAFFDRLNKTAEKAWLRGLLKMVGKPELQWYYENYYEKIKERSERSRKTGEDPLFHGAPAAILIGAQPGASCPAEDALIASHNIGLAAHAMGLGTCYIGYAVNAMKRDSGIKRAFNIPEDEEIYAVMAIGRPNEKWRRTAGRLKVEPRIFRG